MKENIEEYKQKYYSIEYIICPALNNKKIYFNHYGFGHLIRKGRKFRSKKEQKRRFGLLKNVTFFIKKSKIKEKRKIRVSKKIIKYWSLVSIIAGKEITIIVRRINEGEIHFYSIFDN